MVDYVIAPPALISIAVAGGGIFPVGRFFASAGTLPCTHAK